MHITVNLPDPAGGSHPVISPASFSDWGVAITLNATRHAGANPDIRTGELTYGQAQDPAQGRSDRRTDDHATGQTGDRMGGQLSFEYAEQSVVWDVVVEPVAGGFVVGSRIYNHGDEAVTLGEVIPVHCLRVAVGDAGDRICLLPYQSWTEQRVYDLHDPDLPTRAKIKTQVWNGTRRIALQAAFLTFEDVDTNVIIEPAVEGGSFTLSACCDFDGWHLPPGASVATETFRLLVGTDPYVQLEEWAQQAADRLQPKIWPANPHGWLGWSWVDAVNGESYESVALGNLGAIRQRLNGLGIDYLWTSMNNFEGSQPGNWLRWNHRCIPSGREAFLGAVQKEGFTPGFWIGPFYISSVLPDLVAELAAADALLRDAEGELLVVCPEWRHGDAGLLPQAERAHLYSLDPTHPQALEFLEKVFATYHEWGVRYYMIDFLEAAAGKLGRFPYDRLHDDSMIPGPQAYRHCLETIKRVAGDDTFLLSSSGPKMHNAGPIDGVRVGNDLGEGRAITPDSFFYPASYVINNMSFWTAAGYALNCMGAYYHTHRTLYVNNAGNVLTVGQPVPLNEARVMATLHALSGGPTMLGDDIRRLSQERLQLIARTFPRSHQTARPLDLFDSISPVGPRRFFRHAETAWGSYRVLALFNLTREPEMLVVDLEELGFGATDTCLIWEFWNERYLGSFEGQVTIHLSPESVQVLRFVEAAGQPAILGTDMHVLMGEAEITAFSYDPATMICDIATTRPQGQSGMVFIHAPTDLRVVNFDGLHIAKDGHDDSLIIGVPLSFDDTEHIESRIEFAPLDEMREMTAEDLA